MKSKPTYPALEAWLREQKSAKLDAVSVAKLNDSITGYHHTDESRSEILATSGIADDGSILDAVSLNTLDTGRASTPSKSSVNRMGRQSGNPV